MNEKLKKNICGLSDSVILRKVEDLSDRRKAHIGDALEYACCFWTGHLLSFLNEGSGVEEVQKVIDKFFTTCLLFWIEALSLMGKLDIGVHALNDIQQWCALVSSVECSFRKPLFTLFQAGNSSKWANDSQRLILEWFDTICDSPSQVYHLALPFCPSSSWLRECYRMELSQEDRVIKGLPAEWGTNSRTVAFPNNPLCIAYWKNTIAVGSESQDIIILDGITGSQITILSGHIDDVRSLAFSSDGWLLVSGSNDKTIKLWDVQTGGIIKTLYGHTQQVLSVSISADCTMIASGSEDKTIRLWEIHPEKCHWLIDQQYQVDCVRFSPTDTQYLVSVSGDKVQQWGINGHQIGPTHSGSHITFSLDGTQFILCQGEDIVVQNSGSGEILAKFYVSNSKASHCCFSPDGRLVAAVIGASTIYIWDTSSDQHLIKTIVGHTSTITSLTFLSPSSLVSSSLDQSVKFWQICPSPTESIMIDPKSQPLAKAPIKSITLQAGDGIVLSSDSDGVVKTWDILTGLCRTSFQTQATDPHQRDVQLIDGRVILVWQANNRIHILDVEQANLLQTVNTPRHNIIDLWISGDGAKVFFLSKEAIQAWSIWTGEMIDGVIFQSHLQPDSLTMDGAKVWVHFVNSPPQGWDFGIPGESPIPISNLSPNKPRLDITDGTEEQNNNGIRIRNAATGHELFQLSGRFGEPHVIQCDHKYLAAGYESGEVLILDFDHILPQ